ncbi:MAG: ABC transporter ATP-binding protein [Clostridiales bacterium]|nr:ABC transporter ATP-binding protein [Clostridiales bacterium]
MEGKTLEVRSLTVCFRTEKGVIRPVDDVSLEVPAGHIVGIVGESGCGKSMTARAIMGLLRFPGRITGGSVLLEGREITAMPEKERRKLRGAEISMIFQEPMTSLNPVVKVGKQVEEVIRLHTACSREEARRRTLEMFREVEIPEPEVRCSSYPHQLSGGLRQRVMIAMAMVCRPKLLIADEPTTALDVTVEAQILTLLERLRDAGTSILVISHNLGVIARLCDEVYVMYAGQIVEQAETGTIFRKPAHPYTKGLFRSVASLREGQETLETIPGVVPNLLHLPDGCRFSLRCENCAERCQRQIPELSETEPDHRVRCFLAKEGEGA